jgi:hypothetical protein
MLQNQAEMEQQAMTACTSAGASTANCQAAGACIKNLWANHSKPAAGTALTKPTSEQMQAAMQEVKNCALTNGITQQEMTTMGQQFQAQHPHLAGQQTATSG